MKNKRLAGTYTRQEALDAQGDGWRLPNIFELVDIQAANNDDATQGYWSASPYISTASYTWFNTDNNDAGQEAINNYVYLVRREPVVQAPVTRDEVRSYKLKQQSRKGKTIKLEVGKKYETETGEIHEVIYIVNNPKVTYPVITITGENGSVETYTLDSIYDIHAHSKGKNNLVREYHEEMGEKVHEGVRRVERYPAGVTSKYIKSYTLCGYTKAQWKHIIEGGFFCEFSHNAGQEALIIQTLKDFSFTDGGYRFKARGGTGWEYCSPVRDAGIRQPWFGGEQPVSDGTRVLVKTRAGDISRGLAENYNWYHSDAIGDIVGFVYLERFAEE